MTRVHVNRTGQPGGKVGVRKTSNSPLVGRNAQLGGIAIAVLYILITVLSMRQTSATFDEILLPAAGARGYATGDFDLVKQYHPRLMPYIYGLPLAASGVELPAATEPPASASGSFDYARNLFFGPDSDVQKLLFPPRLIAVMIAASLVFFVFTFVRRYYGVAPALLAAAMTAFLPDLIAHGGISYNDVPGALAVFSAVWALDRAAATAGLKEIVLAAFLTAVALAVKYSALALAPIALILIWLEAVDRGPAKRAYLTRVARMLPVGITAAYLTLVAVYLGDLQLASLREGLLFNVAYAVHGDTGTDAWLLGSTSSDGFWYFFPVAFLIRTPVALHALLGLAVAGFIIRPHGGALLLRPPLRGPVVAVTMLACFLLTSSLNIGFRHAMPVLPLLLVIAAAGLARLWQLNRKWLRAAIVGLVVAQAVSVLSWYPHFIPYQSEYFPDRDRGHTRLTDSSHDWGQGLTLLRTFMDEEDVSAVYLSYFGSAAPEAYGINYVPLESFFPLSPAPAPAETPRFTAVSATNLVGAYIGYGLAHLRDVEPYRVLGHTIFIYRTGD
jgi:hypothetical protein